MNEELHRVRARIASSRGFCLIEVLVALAILSVAMLSLAQVAAASASANRAARAATLAGALAEAKIEELRGAVWRFEPDGTELSDPRLAESPPGTLQRSVAGYSEFLDRDGRLLGTDGSMSPGAALVRRWSITRAPGPADSLVLQVFVAPRESVAGGDRASDSGRTRSMARLVAVKTRKGF